MVHVVTAYYYMYNTKGPSANTLQNPVAAWQIYSKRHHGSLGGRLGKQVHVFHVAL